MRPCVPSSSNNAPWRRSPTQFGYKPTAFNVMISRFRAQVRHEQDSPLFVPDGRGRPPGQRLVEDRLGPDEAPVADQTTLEPDVRTLGCGPATAGVFLFLPLLAQLRFDQIVAQAGYPGSEMVPASAAPAGAADAQAPRQGTAQPHQRLQLRRGPGPLRRPEHPPQEVVRHRLLLSDHAREPTRPARRMGAGIGAGAVPRGRHLLARLPSHPLPGRSDGARSALPPAPRRGRPQHPDLLRPGAREPLLVLCQRQPDPRRSARRTDAVRRILARASPATIPSGSISIPRSSTTRRCHGSTPEASTSSPSAVAASAILRRLEALPRSGWTGAVLDTPQRCHQRIRYVDEIVKLRGYEGPIRQLAVDGLGREKPTLFLSNHCEGDGSESDHPLRRAQPRGRRPGDQRELLSSRLLGERGPAQCGLGRDPDRPGQRLLPLAGQATAGLREGRPQAVVPPLRGDRGACQDDGRRRSSFSFDRRSHNPILREAALDREATPIPWLGGRRIRFTFE